MNANSTEVVMCVQDVKNETGQQRAVYFAEDIQKALGLGKSKTYEYLQEVYRLQKPFRVIKVGKLFRIPKNSFDNWLYGVEEVS